MENQDAHKMKWQKVALLFTIIFAGGGIVTYEGLFSGLFLLSGMNATWSGNKLCNIFNECPAYINTTSTYWEIRFAHYNGTKYEDKTLFKKVMKSRTLHVNLDKISNILSTNPDVKVDWYVPTTKSKAEYIDVQGGYWRLIKDGDKWKRKNVLWSGVNKNLLVARPDKAQVIKWNFDIGNVGGINIDPIWVSSEQVYKNYTRQKPVYKYDLIEVKPKFIEKNKTTFPGYNYTKRTKIGYEDIVYQKPAERTDYVGMIIGNTYFKNVVRETDGKYYQYKEHNPKIFCKDCRCRQYEQDSGICWELKLNLTAISSELTK